MDAGRAAAGRFRQAAGGILRQKNPGVQGEDCHVDAKNTFIVIDKGPKDGIRVGTEFTIVREEDGAFRFLGKGVCEKFLGQNSMSKIAVTSGDVRELLPGD